MRFATVKKILDCLSAQRAHRLVLNNLDWFTVFGLNAEMAPTAPENPVWVMGIRFPNAVGLAAGFDTNGECISSLGGYGFGHIEVGSLSASPITGSFDVRREKKDGLTLSYESPIVNDGIDKVLVRLKSADAYHLRGGVLGINLRLDPTRAESSFDDLALCFEKAYKKADYVTLNAAVLSCDDAIRAVRYLLDTRQRLLDSEPVKKKPIAVKIAPEAKETLLPRLDALLKSGAEALIATSGKQSEGGKTYLSGRALTDDALKTLFLVTQHIDKAVPVIACGGIRSGEEALSRIQAGASLVQLLTGFVEFGPALVYECIRAIKSDGLGRAAQTVRHDF